jgi:hypothetical protein
MKKLALLLSFLALGSLGLVACGGGGDDEATAAFENETTVGSGGEAATVDGDPGAKDPLSLRERIRTKANAWAALFAEGGWPPSVWRYMRQPAGERMGCERVGNNPIKNCTPVSAEFRESFADATVERVVIDGQYATAEFSNGESVEFEGPAPWYITERWVKTITRGRGTGANHRLTEERIEQKGNKWAAAFATGRAACRYMGQPACEWMTCHHHLANPMRNCTPVSVEFRRTFDGAMVERVVVSEDHRQARGEFSNGESVEFEGQRADEGDKGEGWGNWAYFITERWIRSTARR